MMTLHLDDEAKNFLCNSGHSPINGARLLNRAIQTNLLNPLSNMILNDRIRDGEEIRVTFDRRNKGLHIIPNHDGIVMDVGIDVDIQLREMD